MKVKTIWVNNKKKSGYKCLPCEQEMSTTAEKYMKRCFAMAEQGLGKVSPNPMVGALLVLNDLVIGEGFHQQYGGPHAEVNAIASVKDSSLLHTADLYVNLEPCSHFGKTPPCADLIIEKGIRRVIICNQDPNPLVAGKGIEKLRAAGVEVIVGILEQEGSWLNRRFFTFQTQQRPYIILKWAQTVDGFISRFPVPDNPDQNWISGTACKQLSHRWRTEEDAIMIGTNTALNDNPRLTARLAGGRNPLRVIIDKKLMVPEDAKVFNADAPTIVFTEKVREPAGRTEFITTRFDDDRLNTMLTELHQRNITSLIVEGGAILLNSFLATGLWDEARVIVANKRFEHGIKAPVIALKESLCKEVENDKVYRIVNRPVFAPND